VKFRRRGTRNLGGAGRPIILAVRRLKRSPSWAEPAKGGQALRRKTADIKGQVAGELSWSSTGLGVTMSKRNGSLDVLRALAIVWVVNCHIVSAFGTATHLAVLQLGGKGVDLFFVLSGWLLGRQLLNEVRQAGTIDVRRFWYRRWLRTLPAYYTVLLPTLLWQLMAHGPSWEQASFLVFGQNYLPSIPCFGVSWSLCVEEHFYLLVAPVLLLLFRFRTAVVLLPALLLVPHVCRVMGWYHSTVQTHVRWDQCASGVLLAYVSVFRPAIWARSCRLAPALALAGLGFACFNVLTRLNPAWGVGDLNTTSWLLIFATWVLLANSGEFWKSGFRFAPIRYLADRAYSLYLLHVESFAILKKLGNLNFVEYMALSWLISLILAEVLYRTVERPVMNAREKFAASRAPGEAPARAETPPPATAPEQLRAVPGGAPV
jgi:peptidoglycan/LPS O-acetylase OafA/YrhL